MTQETSAPRTTDSSPPQRSREQEADADPPPTARPARRVPLDRLLIVVVLNPAQASLVAARLLAASAVQGTTDGTHRGEDGRWTVAVAPSGDVEVTRAQADEGATVTELLEQLRHNAGRLPAHPSAEQLVLLRRLEEATTHPDLEPAQRARVLEEALTEALGPGAPQRLTGQLAALVDAFAHIAPSAAAPVGAPVVPGAPPPDPHRAAPARFTPSRPWRGPATDRRRVRPRRLALLALLLVAALAGSGYVLLRSPDDGTAGATGRDDSSDASDTTGPSDSRNGQAQQPRSRPRTGIEALAPRQAGPITGVEVQKVGGCTPGTLCPVTVTTRFRPASTTQAVTWRVGTARSCRGDVTWSPPITVTAQPGWTSVYASSSVPVPEGGSPALVAVTTTPARAQSPPVPVTGPSLRC